MHRSCTTIKPNCMRLLGKLFRSTLLISRGICNSWEISEYMVERYRAGCVSTSQPTKLIAQLTQSQFLDNGTLFNHGISFVIGNVG